MEAFRQWCDKWDSTVAVCVGLVAVPGLFLAAMGLWLQYDELIDAELDAARRFQLIEKTINELSTQTSLEIDENTIEASESFFEKRADPAYEALFEKLEKAELDKMTPEMIREAELSLSVEFSHFQSTWQEVLTCKEPHCRVFDMLHDYHVQDICEVALADAHRLETIIQKIPGYDEEKVASRLRGSVFGKVMCLCPSDWATWNSEASPICAE